MHRRPVVQTVGIPRTATHASNVRDGLDAEGCFGKVDLGGFWGVEGFAVGGEVKAGWRRFCDVGMEGATEWVEAKRVLMMRQHGGSSTPQATRQDQQQQKQRVQHKTEEREGCTQLSCSAQDHRQLRFGSIHPQRPKQTAQPSPPHGDPTNHFTPPPLDHDHDTPSAPLALSTYRHVTSLEHQSRDVNHPAGDDRLPLGQLAHNQHRRPRSGLLHQLRHLHAPPNSCPSLRVRDSVDWAAS